MGKDKGILRIFPKRTPYTPDDELVYCTNGVNQAPILEALPEFKEIHISCIFTWDKKYCQDLKFQLEGQTNKPVKIGGPAFESYADSFTPGLYMKKNIIFTSRGCNNNCPWCIVPRIEGKLKEQEIHTGNIIQDNNFMQTSKQHKGKVFEMLRGQKGICFKGGLEAKKIDDHFVEAVRGLRIKELWLACDTDAELPVFKKACHKLVKAGFSRSQIKCYALIGKNMERDENRLREIYIAGAMPFAMLYRDFGQNKTKYSKEYEQFARMWQRPPALEAHMKKNTDFRDFRK